MRLFGVIYIFLYFLGYTLAVPASSDSNSGIFGGSKDLEETFNSDDIINLVVFLERDHWKDNKKIQDIETAFKNIVLTGPAQSSIDVWAASYKDAGTPFILIRGEYKSLGDFIHKESTSSSPGIIQYLSAWFILDTKDAVDNKIDDYDAKQYPGIEIPNDMRKRSGLSTKETPRRKSRGGFQESVTIQNLEEVVQDRKVQKRGAAPWDDPIKYPDFEFYSKPPGDHLEWDDDPWFEDSEGKDIDVFVLDTGLADHADELETFRHAYQNNQIKGWLLPRGPLATNEHREKRYLDDNGQYDINDSSFHGTQVISKIIDERVGFARKANIWVAALYDKAENSFQVYVIDLLFQILEKIDEETSPTPIGVAVTTKISNLHGRGYVHPPMTSRIATSAVILIIKTILWKSVTLYTSATTPITLTTQWTLRNEFRTKVVAYAGEASAVKLPQRAINPRIRALQEDHFLQLRH
ncbi:hypothetical protein AA313_de0201038 [Arthrobotrys entomopaga]|nr:hypothetical protein AA313_de0201038 [Arthrobotrys entomopaga]